MLGTRLHRLKILHAFGFTLGLVLENEREKLVVQNVDELTCPHRKVNDTVFECLSLREKQSDLFYNGGFANPNQSMDKHDWVLDLYQLDNCLGIDLAPNDSLIRGLFDLKGKYRLLVDELNLTLLEWA